MVIEASMDIISRIKQAVFNYTQERLQITPSNIPKYIYPLVQYIYRVQPDYIIVLDSGARLSGVAVHLLYQKLYGRLPTVDHLMHFSKVSHFSPFELNREELRPDVERMLPMNPNPLLFVMDDWINTGMTQRMIKHIISDLSGNKIKMRFGVMRELFTGIADVSGARFSGVRTSWRDNTNLIGIRYEGLTRQRVACGEALRIRQQISVSIERFVKNLGGS